MIRSFSDSPSTKEKWMIREDRYVVVDQRTVEGGCIETATTEQTSAFSLCSSLRDRGVQQGGRTNHAAGGKLCAGEGGDGSGKGLSRDANFTGLPVLNDTRHYRNMEKVGPERVGEKVESRPGS